MFSTVVVLVAGFTGSASMQSASDEELVNGHRARAREVIIKYRSAPTAEKLATDAASTDAIGQRKIARQEHWRVKSASKTVATMMASLAGDPDIEYVEPNYIIASDADPTDTFYPTQWALKNTGQVVNTQTTTTPGADIEAPLAWDISRGSRSVVVAVLDSGIEYAHPDLNANVWSAPSPFTVTIGGTTLTCPAGTRGFNAITFTCDVIDDLSHGTHIGGVIGAVGNNASGVTGVSQVVTLLPLKILNASGVGTVADAIEAIEFAIQTKAAFAATNGANVRILNNSWGGTSYSQALYDEIAKAASADMLFVASAGNAGACNDVLPYYPSGYNLANVLSVGASDANDYMPLFSNYGTTTVDLSAPGVDIYSTAPGDQFAFKTGTSQSTAFVSGAAALVLSSCTTLTTAALRSNLLAGVEIKASLSGTSATGGRLNVNNSVRACAPTSKPGTPAGLAVINGNTTVLLSWTPTPGATSYVVKKATKSTGTYTAIASGVSTNSYTVSGLTNGSTSYYKVAAVNLFGTSADSAYVTAKPAVPPAPTGLAATAGINQIALKWTASAGATSYVVKKATSATGTYTAVASGVTATGFTVTGLTNGTAYYFKVAATTPVGTSADTASVTGTPVACPTPTGLVAAGGVSQVALTWTATTGAMSYVVKKATSATGTYTAVATGVTAASYTVTGLTNGTALYFKVAAVNANGTSADSAYVTATPATLPTAPTAPKTTAGTGKITVAWTAATGATGYNIYRSTTAGGPYVKIATTTSVSYINSSLVKGTKYFYVIKAYNKNNAEGPSSLEVSATVN